MTSDEQRTEFRKWATEEADPYYRMEFYRLSLSRRQRMARWWWLNWSAVTLVATLGLAALGVWYVGR